MGTIDPLGQEVGRMKALKAKTFSKLTDDGEIVLDKAHALPVKYIKDVYRDDSNYYIVPRDEYQHDRCFEEYYRDILVELPQARKCEWAIVDYERARCRNCFAVFSQRDVIAEIDLLSNEVVLRCPRCGSSEFDPAYESYLEVY